MDFQEVEVGGKSSIASLFAFFGRLRLGLRFFGAVGTAGLLANKSSETPCIKAFLFAACFVRAMVVVVVAEAL